MRRALAAVLLVALGVSCAPQSGRTLVAVFDDVEDLVPRANVQLSDAVVGTVSALELDDQWNARVTMTLNDEVRVPQGSRAVVRSTSLLGEKYVDIVPPDDVTPRTPEIEDGGVIPIERTTTAPVLEDVLAELGAVLASGALADLGKLTSATARIVEGQEQDIAAVIEGTQALVASLAAQREALGASLDRLGSVASTLRSGTPTVNRFLETSAEALQTLAGQREELGELIAGLDALGRPQAALFERYKDETDRQIKALMAIVGKVHEGRSRLDQALDKLPDFVRLFAASVPGDYIQLDILVEGLPELP